MKNKYTILSKVAKYSFIFVIAFVLIMPVIAVDKVPCDRDKNGAPILDARGKPIPAGCQLIAGGDANTPAGGDANSISINTGIKNPLGDNLKTLPDFIAAILNIVLVIGIPIVALAIIYSGFLFVTAQGNTEKLSKAKKAILYTLIGAALLLGAFVIANAIKGTVEQISS